MLLWSGHILGIGMQSVFRMPYSQIELPSPSCLFVVDPQVQFVNDHTRAIYPRIERIIPRYDFVVYSRLLPDAAGYIERMKRWRPAQPGSAGFAWCVDTQLLPEDRTLRVGKTGFSAFSQDVRTWAGQRCIQEIHICGADTDLCVLMTAAEVMMQGLRPVVLADLCASFAGAPLHGHAVIQLKRMLGKRQVLFSEEEVPALVAAEVC